MKKILFQLLIIISFSLQSQSYHFLHLNVEDGLADNEIIDMIQDKRGAIWIATPGGISVYDGVNFTDLNDSSGLPSNLVHCLYEDGMGDIWIGTHRGLTVFDGIDFHTFTKEDGLSSNIIKSICEDGFGTLWIGTENGGLCKMDNFAKGERSFISFNIDLGDRDELSINKIIETPDAKIYIGTNKGIAEIFNNEIKTYTNKDGLIDSYIYDLHEDVNGDIWFATSSGLSLLSSGKFKNFSKSNGFPFNETFTLEEDKDDNILIGTRNGVLKLNINTYKPEIIFNSDKGLSEDIVKTILEDKHDNIWVGTSGGGVNKITGISFTSFGKKQGLKNEKINGIIQDKKNHFWFATPGGLIKYDENGTNILFNKENGLPKNYIATVYEDSKGNIWASTLNEIFKLKDDKLIATYGRSQGVITSANCFYEDIDGVIWAGTSLGLIQIKDGVVNSYSMLQGLNNPSITSICQDNSGKLWIGTKGGGINWFNGIYFDEITEDDGLIPSNRINCMIQGPRGEIFIGTNSGVTKHDKKDKKNPYKTFNKSNSGISSNNIKMMLFDEDNQLWIGTNEGLDRISFNPPQVTRQTGKYISEVKHFSKSDGINGGKINKNAICEDSEGNLWFGTNKGAIKHDRNVDYTNEIAPKTFFTGLVLENKKVNWSKRNYEVEPWSNMPKNLIIPYDSSTLTFHFVAINHDNSSGTIYHSHLEQDGEIFAPLKSKESKRDFTKLPPGEYRFIVYACNKDEFCTEEQPSTFSFVVSPPFWAEIWFIILSCFIIIFAIFFFIKFREKKLKAERELLEEKVKERNQEVLEKNKELESVNLEIVSANKEIEQKNNDLNSSIRYALTIQKASFPPLQELYEELPNSFIYHLPRDIVSGDFYWYRKTNNKFVIACADCTGHGVPGALTSMIGIALLNEIVGGNQITDPSEVLKMLDEGILKAFENSESETNDGMDISLMTIDNKTKTIEYSGAYRPMIMIRNKEIFEYKATKMSIGFKDVQNKVFEKTTLKFQEKDCFFMYSDGYPDQFGGPKNKKFKTRTLKEMLIEGSSKNMKSQKEIISQRFNEWMGDSEQVDDILIMGIKF